MVRMRKLVCSESNWREKNREEEETLLMEEQYGFLFFLKEDESGEIWNRIKYTDLKLLTILIFGIQI